MQLFGSKIGTRSTARWSRSDVVRWSGTTLLAGITGVKLWLDAAVRVKAESFQTFDDALYVRLARSIIAGEWLGPYDHLTLTKNPGYPLWLAANHWLGTPLLLAQSALYATAGLLLVREIRKLGCHPVLAAIVYAVYLFNPFVETRVMREGIYSALLVLTFAALAAYYRRSLVSAGRTFPAALLLGLALSAAWLTREEGAALLPGIALVLTAAAAALIRRREWRNPDRLLGMAAPIGVLAAAIATVSLVNYRHYGVFTLNEQASRPFTSAVGSLFRVKHTRERPYVLIPKDVRSRVYAVSPSFALLQPFLDGEAGSFAVRSGWIADSCVLYPEACPELGGLWAVWAFRQSAADAGFHSSATTARAYYAAVTDDIDRACRAGELPCSSRSDSIVAPYRSSYLKPLAHTFFGGLSYVLTVPVREYVYSSAPTSTADAEGLRMFGDLTHNRVLPSRLPSVTIGEDADGAGDARLEVLRWTAKAYTRSLSLWVYAGLLAFFASAIGAWRRRSASPLFVLGCAVLVTATVRLAMLAYLDVSMFPAFTLWPAYVTPLYPLLLTFPGLFFADLARQGAELLASRRAAPFPAS